MWIYVILVAAFLCYMCSGRLKTIHHIIKNVNRLPGKCGYPIVGSILEFLGDSEYVFRRATSFYNEHSRNGLISIWLGLLPMVFTTDPEVVELLLRTPTNNTKAFLYRIIRPWLNDGLLTSTGEKWHERRKLLTPAFHFNILQNFLSIFNKESKYFVESLREHNLCEFDVRTAVSKFTLDTICETAMGTSLKDHHKEGEKYRTAVSDFGFLIAERSIKTWLLIETIYRFSTTYWRQEKIVKILHGFSRQVINKRQKMCSDSGDASVGDNASSGFTRKKAMLDLLIMAQKMGSNINDKGIQEEVDTFVFEGHDTTAVSLCFTLMLLANNSICQEKLHEELVSVFGDDDRDPTYSDLQDLKYLECCIKESLRLYPSVPKIGRTLGEDIHLENGLILPKNCSIIVLVYEMHRRADLYPDPEKFDPDRFLLENTTNRHPYAYIPFSAGPRNCIGQKFAMMEMKCLISAVLRKYILEPVDTPKDMECILDLVLRTRNPIRVKFIPR